MPQSGAPDFLTGGGGGRAATIPPAFSGRNWLTGVGRCATERGATSRSGTSSTT